MREGRDRIGRAGVESTEDETCFTWEGDDERSGMLGRRETCGVMDEAGGNERGVPGVEGEFSSLLPERLTEGPNLNLNLIGKILSVCVEGSCFSESKRSYFFSRSSASRRSSLLFLSFSVISAEWPAW